MIHIYGIYIYIYMYMFSNRISGFHLYSIFGTEASMNAAPYIYTYIYIYTGTYIYIFMYIHNCQPTIRLVV